MRLPEPRSESRLAKNLVNVLHPLEFYIIQVRFERYFLPILVHLAHFLKFVDCVNLKVFLQIWQV